MNVYFLVEGRRTERRVYPAWLKHLVPRMSRATQLSHVRKDQYFLFSGEGYPALLNHLKNAISDINTHGRFDWFVLCLDADYCSTNERKLEVETYLKDNNLSLCPNTKFAIIVQNKCIETWFLGNRKFFKRTPQNSKLLEYVQHYNVHDADPEQMSAPDHYNGTVAHFHDNYFRLICLERNCTYSKKQPEVVCQSMFLCELIERFQNSQHLESFGTFLELCKEWR